MSRVAASRRFLSRSPTALFTALVGLAAPPATAGEVTCTSRPGECAIVSSRGAPTWEEVVVQVSDAAVRFHLELTRDGRTLVLDWRGRGDGNHPRCTATSGCEGAPPLDCTDAVVCGETSGTSYCGAFLSADTIELRFRWCRSESEPWPPWPAPAPQQNPPPPPPPKKPKLPEDERREPPGPPRPKEESAWFIERIRDANAVDRPWQASGTLTTRRREPSSVAGRHVPDRTWIEAAVTGEEPTQAIFEANGRLLARRGRSGPYLEIRKAAGSGPSSGGWEPPASTPLLGRPTTPKAKGKSGPLPGLGPSDLVVALDPDRVDYYGLETCGGSELAGVLCHRLDFVDDGVPNSAYFLEESLLLESIVGADRNGPRKIVWRYDPAVAVSSPHASEIRALTGDPQRDLAAMMAILGPP